MAYISKDELKNYTGVNFIGALDVFADLVISQVQLYVEKECGDPVFGDRIFETPAGAVDETRYFNGNGGTKLFVGDLKSFTGLVYDNVTLVKDQDFYLYPLNADKQRQPFMWIELVQPETRLNANPRLAARSPYIFEQAQRNIAVTGQWRYSDSCPADIKLAMLKLAGAVLKENIGDEDIRESKSVSIGDYSINFVEVSQLAHSIKVDDILKHYKRKDNTPAAGFNSVVGAGQQTGSASLRKI